MTSSSEQPPKEYTITEDVANKVCYVLVSNGENRLANKLCSRPHPAPAQGLNFRPECPHHMYYEEYMGEPEKHICNKRKEWETEAARKAREDMLKGFDKFIDAYSRQDEDGNDYVSVLALQNHIESLRSTTPQSGQGQPR